MDNNSIFDAGCSCRLCNRQNQIAICMKFIFLFLPDTSDGSPDCDVDSVLSNHARFAFDRDHMGIVILLNTVFDASFVVWMMRSYFVDVPNEMEEAALVDGASQLHALSSGCPTAIHSGYHLLQPLYMIIYSWNDFLFALMLTSPKTKTIPLGILASFSSVEISWGQMTTLSVLAIIPAVIISLFLNRYFVQGTDDGRYERLMPDQMGELVCFNDAIILAGDDFQVVQNQSLLVQDGRIVGIGEPVAIRPSGFIKQ